VHLGVLVLGVELDDGGRHVAAVLDGITAVAGEVLPEDVLRGVSLP
jgi:hypothetical protein